MQEILSISEISQRASVIGLSPRNLAAIAGVHESTISRAFNSDDDAVHARTLRKLSRAVRAHEQGVIQHLRLIYPEIFNSKAVVEAAE